jgi:beta-glucosidase
LSLAAQVAQLIVVRAAGYTFDHQRRYPQWELSQAELQHCIADLGIGGVILLGGSAIEVGVRSQQLQSWADVPLLLAADIEEGVGQRFAGATQFPPPMALSAIAQHNIEQARQYAFAMGAVTAQEAVAIGLNWMLAPVVDVNNNHDNPVINVRAFGETPDLVSALTQAFLKGAQQFPILTTAKHFPGHGDTAIDSHLQLPEIPHHRERLEQVELVPFRSAIASGIDAVMTAHVRVSELDAHLPATLSPVVLTRLLRQDLGFHGLIVTDALIMGAIADQYGPYEAAVLAIEAGADVVLMPHDPEGTIQAICEAVRTGRLPSERIASSVERLWRGKQKVSGQRIAPPEACHAWERVSPPPIQLASLATAEARQTLTHIQEASMQTRGQLVPLSEADSGQSIVLVDDVLNAHWLQSNAPAIEYPRINGYQPRISDTTTCVQAMTSLVQPQRPTLLQIFCRGNPFRGSAGLSKHALTCFQDLQRLGTLDGLIVYGSPYAARFLLAALPDTVPFGFTYGQTPEAQALLLSSLLPMQAAPTAMQTFTD